MLKPIYPLTKENIYYKTNDYSIFRYYCKDFAQINKLFSSPLRKDSNASAIITPYNGKLLFRDFGLGNTFDAVSLVMALFYITFHQALSKINKDLNLGLDGGKDIYYKKYNYDFEVIQKDSVKTRIDISTIPHNNTTYKYWNDYGWTIDMLERAKVRNIDAFWIYKDEEYYFDTEHKLSFSFDYYWRNDTFLRKIYQPNDKNKFFTNADSTVIQGWDLLPKNGNDVLFITSSLKDIGPIWRLGYYAIAPNSEAVFIPEEIFWTKIRPRFKRIIAWLDNDLTGIRNALKWAEKYQIEAVWNPLNAPKDQSDYWKQHGGREFNYLLNKLVL